MTLNPSEHNGAGASATNLIEQSDTTKVMDDESISNSHSNAASDSTSIDVKVTATPESAAEVLQNSDPTNPTADSGGSSSSSSDNALTLPGNCSRQLAKINPPTAEIAAAAAADLNAMPPPPPTTPGSTRPSASTVSSIPPNDALTTSISKATDLDPAVSLASQKIATYTVPKAPSPLPEPSASFAAVAAAKTTAPVGHAPVGKPPQPVPVPAVAPNAPTTNPSGHATTPNPNSLPGQAQKNQSTVVNPNTTPSTVPANRFVGAGPGSVTGAAPRPTHIPSRTQSGVMPPNPLTQTHTATSASKTPAPRPPSLGPYPTVRRPAAPTPGAPMTASKPLQSYAKAPTPISATSQGPPPGAKPPSQMRPYPTTNLSSAPGAKPLMQSVPTPIPSSMHHPHRPAMGVPPHVSLPPMPDGASSSNSVGGGGGGPSKKKGNNVLRRGKWTNEEEAYANRLISEFKAGLLPLTDGTTLRNFLSKLLNCDPMRISKKFVGNNCIGKQVFRRRAADINRLTPEQIQQNRVELSELERRFLDRVAQTNRVKTPGVAAAMTSGAVVGAPVNVIPNHMKSIGGNNILDDIDIDRPSTPPWLKPPANYKSSRRKITDDMTSFSKPVTVSPPGTSPAPPVYATTANNDSTSIVEEKSGDCKQSSQHDTMLKIKSESADSVLEGKSHTEQVMEAMQRSESSQGRLSERASPEGIKKSESALEQLARTASAAKFVEDIVNGESYGDSNDKEKILSHLQGSFEALMSLDLHSVENLVELASNSNLAAMNSNENENKKQHSALKSSVGMSTGSSSSTIMASRMESFIKSLSSANLFKHGFESNAALGGLLQNIQYNLNDPNNSCNSLLEAGKLLERAESSTGFSELRVKDGLANSNSNSVEDFLSLVASGDIPHQDPHMLNVPLQKVMQQGGVGSAASKLAQKQLLALASRASLSRLAESSTSLSKLATSVYNAHCSSAAMKNKRKLDETDLEQGNESNLDAP